jgi:hypothetical protein
MIKQIFIILGIILGFIMLILPKDQLWLAALTGILIGIGVAWK